MPAAWAGSAAARKGGGLHQCWARCGQQAEEAGKGEWRLQESSHCCAGSRMRTAPKSPMRSTPGMLLFFIVSGQNGRGQMAMRGADACSAPCREAAFKLLSGRFSATAYCCAAVPQAYSRISSALSEQWAWWLQRAACDGEPRQVACTAKPAAACGGAAAAGRAAGSPPADLNPAPKLRDRFHSSTFAARYFHSTLAALVCSPPAAPAHARPSRRPGARVAAMAHEGCADLAAKRDRAAGAGERRRRRRRRRLPAPPALPPHLLCC